VVAPAHVRGNHQELGWRAVLPRGALPPGATSPVATSESYDALRLSLGVAEGGELAGELPLELNLDGLDAVSFTKGCYVGQELTSRTHFRGVVRKRAMPVALAPSSGAAAAAAGAQLLPPEGGAPVGRVLAARGGRGVALLRLAAALPSAPGAPPPTLASEGGGTAVPQRPRWWPQAWGAEA
jgi:folate-binding protein YgfZ